jgi:hypothetical protein
MDKFEYVYRGDEDVPISIGDIIETTLCFIAMAVCLVAVMMLWLCG